MSEALRHAVQDHVTNRPVARTGRDTYRHRHDGEQPMNWPPELVSDFYAGDTPPPVWEDEGIPSGDSPPTGESDIPMAEPGGEIGNAANEASERRGVSRVIGHVASKFLRRGDEHEDLARRRRDIPADLQQTKGTDSAPPPNAPARDHKKWERIRRKDAQREREMEDLRWERNMIIDRSHSTQGLRSGKIMRNNITWRRRQMALEELANPKPRHGFVYTMDGRKIPTIYDAAYKEPLLDMDDHLPQEEQQRIKTRNAEIKAANKERAKRAEAKRQEKIQEALSRIDPSANIDDIEPIDLRSVPINIEEATLTDEEQQDAVTMVQTKLEPELKRRVDSGDITPAEARRLTEERTEAIEVEAILKSRIKPVLEKELRAQIRKYIDDGMLTRVEGRKLYKKEFKKRLKAKKAKITDDRQKLAQIEAGMASILEAHEDERTLSDLDRPDEAIDRINNHTRRGGTHRSTEAKQLRQWLRINRKVKRLTGEHEEISERADGTSRRIRRKSRLERNSASRLIGVEKKRAEMATRAGERAALAKDSLVDKRHRASIKTLEKRGSLSRFAGRKIGKRAGKLYRRNLTGTRLSRFAKEHPKLQKAADAQRSFAQLRRRKYSRSTIKAYDRALDFDTKRKERKLERKDHLREALARSRQVATRRNEYEGDKNARIQDRERRKEGHIEDMVDSQHGLRADFIRGMKTSAVKNFDNRVNRVYGRMLDDFRDTHGRDPYQREGARMLLQATRGTIKDIRHKGIKG